MEQRKSDINTDDGNVVNVDANGLSYSFDFSSQVTPDNASPVSAPEVSTPEVPNMPSVDSTVAGQAAPVVDPVVAASEPVTLSGGTSEMVDSNVNSSVEPVTPSEPAIEQVTPSEPTIEPVTPSETAIEPSAMSSDLTSNEVAPSEMPQDASEVKEEVKQEQVSDEILIKDKKATKNFLIIIFVIVVAFIIALPFIFNFFK